MLKPNLRLVATLLMVAYPAVARGQPASSAKLPWEKSGRQQHPIVRPPSGPQEILERYGIGPDRLAEFASGHPFSPAEGELALEILYRLPRIGLEFLERWRQKDVTLKQIAAAPSDYRADVFHLRGRVRRAVRHEVPARQAEMLELEHFFEVTFVLPGESSEVTVFARQIPASWPLDATLDEPASVDALFLKTGEQQLKPAQLYFAAGRVAWFPEQALSNFGIGASQISLAKAGMDASLWDDVRQTNRAPLGEADREAFYQLLAALGTSAGQIRASWDKPLDVVPLLTQPSDWQGSVLPVAGRTQRIMKIAVADEDIHSRFGLDHYYEIDMLLPLSGTSLRLGDEKSGDKRPVFSNDFPATLIVRDLPPGLYEGESVRELIRADAVFFKIWTYRAGYTEQFGQVQPAPLFLAGSLALQPHTTVRWDAGLFFFAALGLTIFILMTVIWWTSRDHPKRSTRRYLIPR